MFREDLNFEIADSFEENFRTDAVLLPSFLAQQFKEGFLKFPIQPEELIPNSGQGAFGFLCLKSNLKMRKILKRIHHKSTAAETNVERAIQRDLNQPVVAFCKKNNLNHFHVYATALRDGQLYHFSLSSSTSVGLEERVVQELGG